MDGSKNIVQETHFDPWGNRMTYNVWNSKQTQTSFTFDRGFTGHEHYDRFKIINANARLYDPTVGRFFSPDPLVQAPDFTQSFNRYSYCLNNPIMYSDPDGEAWHLAIGAALGGITNLAFNWNNCDGFLEYATAFLVGAAGGFVTSATGGAGASMWAVSGVAAAGGALTSATNSMIAQTGKNFSGINSVSWEQVATSSLIGATSSFVGGMAGGYAGTQLGGVMINGLNITSPVVKGVVAGSIGGMVGGAAAGYVGGYIATGSSEEAFNSALSGMWQGAVLGGVSGGIGAYAAAKNAGINPWKEAIVKRDYVFSLTDGDNITLYRGTNGNEGYGRPLHFTDDPNYAQQYCKDGYYVIEVTIPKITFKMMCYDGIIYQKTGYYYNNHNIIANEYIINSEYSNLIYSLSKKYNP